VAQQKADYPLDYGVNPAHPAENQLRTTADRTADRLKNVAENARDLAENVAGQARHYGEKAQEAAENFKPFVEKSMKDQPMTTLAAAAAIGFALGALWKR
jgi:ElaB/YqjD/DUF883 family membrane-anchored ribosome-binding protein